MIKIILIIIFSTCLIFSIYYLKCKINHNNKLMINMMADRHKEIKDLDWEVAKLKFKIDKIEEEK